jgi:DNA-binding FadR family transcriptional regulator
VTGRELPGWWPATTAQVEWLATTLAQLRGELMAGLDDLKAQVTQTLGVQQSAVALLQGLHAALLEAIASGDLATVAQVVDDLKASTDALAAAVEASPVPVEEPPAP